MNTILPMTLAALLAVPAAAPADEIYRCVENGKTAFTSVPGGENCVPVTLDVYQPDPEDVARRLRQKELDAERDQQERLIRAREAQARATERLAAAQRRLAAERALDAQTPQPVTGWWSPAWAPAGIIHPYFHHPHFHHAPALPGPAAEPPGHSRFPYAPGQMAPAGGRR
jgi:hypothetical protein